MWRRLLPVGRRATPIGRASPSALESRGPVPPDGTGGPPSHTQSAGGLFDVALFGLSYPGGDRDLSIGPGNVERPRHTRFVSYRLADSHSVKGIQEHHLCPECDTYAFHRLAIRANDEGHELRALPNSGVFVTASNISGAGSSADPSPGVMPHASRAMRIASQIFSCVPSISLGGPAPHLPITKGSRCPFVLFDRLLDRDSREQL